MLHYQKYSILFFNAFIFLKLISNTFVFSRIIFSIFLDSLYDRALDARRNITL